MNDKESPDILDRLQTSIIDPVPDFPSRSLCDPATLAASFGWAQLLLNIHGIDAPYYALNAVLCSIREQDQIQFRGWRNISDAMTEILRTPEWYDRVH
jgi:hypothetical protein